MDYNISEISKQEDFTMKVLIITGSAHKSGTTSALAQSFINGANDAGHEIYRFDAAFKNVHPCIACERCHNTHTGCAFQDDMNELNPHLLNADAVIFVSPIYYYGLNAQIKTVIDRFYANDPIIHENKKTALLLAMADDTMASAEGAIATFKGMANFLEWNIAGIVVAAACEGIDSLRGTPYPKQAYDLGKNLQFI